MIKSIPSKSFFRKLRAKNREIRNQVISDIQAKKNLEKFSKQEQP